MLQLVCVSELYLHRDPSRARTVSLSVTPLNRPQCQGMNSKLLGPPRRATQGLSCPPGALGFFLTDDTLVSDKIWGQTLPIKQINKSVCCCSRCGNLESWLLCTNLVPFSSMRPRRQFPRFKVLHKGNLSIPKPCFHV